MATHFDNILSAFVTMTVMILIAHYIFLEPAWKKYQPEFYIISLLLISGAEFFLPQEAATFVPVACAGVYFMIARSHHRIGGFLLTVPILGICFGFSLLFVYLPPVLFALPDDKLPMYYFAIDNLFRLLLLLFLWKGKSWREEFHKELQYRSLEQWERRLLNISALLIWAVCLPITSIEDWSDLTVSARFYIGVVLFVTFSLTITVMILILQGNKRAYYHGIATLNEQYLQSELRHFEAYRNTQKETRRIRHDMKNHMMCLQHLVQSEDYEELKKYIETLTSTVEQIDTELHCGNSLIDAICNEKYLLATQNDISFEIEGFVPESLHIRPLDLCTIFANALDNAIESAQKVAKEQRFIRLTLSSQGQFLFIKLVNPVLMEQTDISVGKTTKPDTQNHGFGLQNIQRAVLQYHGTMNTSVEKSNHRHLFVLELMLVNA